MNIGDVWAVFKQINSDKYTDAEKLDAIDVVVNAETHNSMRKDEILEAFKWFLSKNKWISVKDRLPDGECLAVGFQNEMIIGYVDKDEASGAGYSAENDSEILHDVTHWMPLPKPPKGD